MTLLVVRHRGKVIISCALVWYFQHGMGLFLACEESSAIAHRSTRPRRPASCFIEPHLLAALEAFGDVCREMRSGVQLEIEP